MSNNKISKREIIDFLIRVYCHVTNEDTRKEIKKFVMKLRESDL